MEYVQMTLDDWLEVKKRLKQELLGVKQSFVRIGYVLRQIEDQKLYERDGYKSIAEFAKEEYGLEPSTTSRFMSINREYSVDGYSETLRPEFADLGRSQLEEMLKLPDSDRQMIQPEASREDIRELKRFNKAEPAAGIADDIDQLIEKFYQDNKELRKAVAGKEYDESNIKQFAELINPSGNRSYKKGLYFLMMYENRVSIKKFGQTPQDMTWWQFWKKTEAVLANAAECGGKDEETNQEPADNTQTEKTGTETKPEKNDTREQETGTGADAEPGTETEREDGAGTMEDHAETHEPTEHDVQREEDRQGTPDRPADREVERTKAIAPAQKTAESLEETPVLEEAMNEPEIVEQPFGTRKEYLDSLTAYGTAAYLVGEYKNNRLTEAHLTSYEKMENWLLEKVDSSGRMWVDE